MLIYQSSFSHQESLCYPETRWKACSPRVKSQPALTMQTQLARNTVECEVAGKGKEEETEEHRIDVRKVPTGGTDEKLDGTKLLDASRRAKEGSRLVGANANDNRLLLYAGTGPKYYVSANRRK